MRRLLVQQPYQQVDARQDATKIQEHVHHVQMELLALETPNNQKHANNVQTFQIAQHLQDLGQAKNHVHGHLHAVQERNLTQHQTNAQLARAIRFPAHRL